MNLNVPCLGCNKPLLLKSELAGRKVTCPHCRVVFESPRPAAPVAAALNAPEPALAPAAPPSVPTAQASDLDFYASRQEKADAAQFSHDFRDWNLARNGLQAIALGLGLFSITPLVAFGLGILDFPINRVFGVLLQANATVGLAIAYTGFWLLAGTPHETGLRRWTVIIAACLSGAVAAGLVLIAAIRSPELFGAYVVEVARIALYAMASLTGIGWIGFLGCQFGVCAFFGDRRQRDRLIRFAAVHVLLIAVVGLGYWQRTLLVRLLREQVSAELAWAITRIVLVGLFVVPVALIIWFLALIRGTVAVIDRATKASRQARNQRPRFDTVGVAADWQHVSAGLKLVMIGVLPSYLLASYCILAPFAPKLIADQDLLKYLSFFAQGLAALAAAGLLAAFFGLVQCLRVPGEARLHGPILVALCCFPIAPALLALSGGVKLASAIRPLHFAWPESEPLLLAAMFGVVVAVIGKVLFVWFLRSASLFFGSKYLTRGVDQYLAGFLIVPAVSFLAEWIITRGDLGRAAILRYLLALFALVPLILFIWLATVLRHVRKMIEVALRRQKLDQAAESSPLGEW